MKRITIYIADFNALDEIQTTPTPSLQEQSIIHEKGINKITSFFLLTYLIEAKRITKLTHIPLTEC